MDAKQDFGIETKSDVHVFYSLMEFLARNPSEQTIMAPELVQLLDSDSEVVKFTLEFYKNVFPTATNSLLRYLFAQGVVSEDIISKSCLGPFLSQLLFQTVTSWSVDCAEYCARVWIDRVTGKEKAGIEVRGYPNPIEYLNPRSPNQASPIPFSAILQFKLLDEKQRKLILLDFRKLVNLTPVVFHSRLAVAFFIFLEFYKKENHNGSSSCSPEICLWIETFVKLIVSSLSTSLNICWQDKNMRQGTPLTKPAKLHHVLCGLMVSSKAVEFVASDSCLSKNILETLEKLVECSSGFTEKWLNALILEVRSKVKG